MKRMMSIFLIATIMTSYFSYTIAYSLNNGDGLADSPWPMFSHDLKHSGKSEYYTVNNLGGEKYRIKTGWIDSSPAIAKDGTIYVGSLDEYLYAINLDGNLKWKFKTNMWITSSPAIAEDGTIYVGSWDCYFYAINPDGNLKWKFKAGGGIFSSPAIGNDGTIYFGVLGPGEKGRLYALNPDGTEKWHFDTGWWIYSSPAIGNDGTVYIGSHDCYLYAINPDGSLKWKFKTGEEVKSSPAIAEDGTIYVGSWDDYLYAINPDGSLKWKFKTDSSIDCSPAIAEDGTIYVGTYNGWFYAINPDGSLKWKIHLAGAIYSSPAIGKEGIIYVGGGGKLYAVNPDSTIKWTVKMLSNEAYDGCSIISSPAIGKDGTIYIGSWFGSEKGDWGYLHAIKDGMPKGVEIVRPKQDYLYIFDREIMKIRYTRVIGWITVEPEIISEENVEKVEFYVDYEYKYTDYSPPFEWKWNERIIFETRHLSVKVYYNDGDVVASKIKVVDVFNPFGK